MDKKFQIGEIARFFDMPASTFRYWEDKGILHPRKKIENQYREYAIEDLMTIGTSTRTACTSDGEITLSYEGVEDIGGIENTDISRV